MQRRISHLMTRERQWRLDGSAAPNGQPLAHLVFFEADSLLVPDGYDTLLAAHTRFLQDHPRQVAVISGHSYGSGSHRFYWLMGERRAMAVQQALLRAGAAPEQLQVQSKGGLRPMIELAGQAVSSYCRRVSIDHVSADASTQVVPALGSAEWWRAVMGPPATASRLPLAGRARLQ